MPRVVFGVHKKEWSNVGPKQTQNVLVYVPYVGGALPSEGEEEEEAVNYVFLLDVSSSMKSNNKLRDATNAVVAALNMVTTGSTVSLLLFESYTTERFPPTVVTDASRDDLSRNIRRIMSDGVRMGSTNMSVALKTAQEQVAQQCSTDGTIPERACVIMFTDGRPTTGLCEYEGLVAATTTMWAAIPSARLCVINFGPDADTELSRALAEAGSGDFFHTDDGGEGLKLALASVIGATRAVVATDVTMQYAVTAGTADITAVHGGVRPGHPLQVQIGDVPEEAVRGIAFALKINAGDAAPIQLDVQLTGWETGTGVAINETTTIIITRRDEPLAAEPDLEANDQLQRVTAASAMDDAAIQMDYGDVSGAKQSLNSALQAVQSSPAGVAGCTLATHMCQELTELIQQPAATTGSSNLARLKSNANMRMRSDVRALQKPKLPYTSNGRACRGVGAAPTRRRVRRGFPT
jgi:Mg-chelatase subunit ChlD